MKEVKVRNKEHYVTLLKRFMMSSIVKLLDTQLEIGDDADAIYELSGTTEKKTAGGYVVYYGPTDPAQARAAVQLDHIRDGLSYLCAAIVASKGAPGDEGEDALLAAMGWAGGKPNGGNEWMPPWSRIVLTLWRYCSTLFLGGFSWARQRLLPVS